MDETRRRDNLPLPSTPLVGREPEIDAVRQRLAGRRPATAPDPGGAASPAARLVTLTGPPGIGKTRLAQAVATELLDAYADGVWLVELAALVEAGGVAPAVAAAVGVREEPGRPLLVALAEALRPRHLLLLLDNCEHLVDAAAGLVETLLAACPRLQILATSREVLGVAGEAPWRVRPLALPDPARLPPVEASAAYPAVRLFVERAAAARPDFALTPDNAAAVVQLCHRLDGIPLAIELAAARVSTIAVEDLPRRLGDRFRLLSRGRRTAPPRQQTLQALVDWSYHLLSAQERALFDRLGVFAAGWTLEAAEAVCAGSGDGRVPLPAAGSAPDHEGDAGPRQSPRLLPEDVLDLLSRLVDKSLVVAEPERPGGASYRLLETLRQYAQQRLEAGGDTARLQARHAAYYVALAEAGAPSFATAQQGAWLARMRQEHDNLRAALRWALRRGDALLGLRLAAAVSWFWWKDRHVAEGRAWLTALLALPPPPARTREQGAHERAGALVGAGVLAVHDGDYAAARARCAESLALQRAAGDAAGCAWSLQVLGYTALEQGDDVAARPLLEESMAIRRRLADRSGIAHAANQLGELARRAGDHATARALFEESLGLRRELGDHWGATASLKRLGEVLVERGQYDDARPLLREALALQRYEAQARPGPDEGEPDWLIRLVLHLAVGRGRGADLDLAAELLDEHVAALGEHRRRRGLADALWLRGVVACAQGAAGVAGACLGQSVRLGLESGDAPALARTLEGFAGVAAGQGQPERALRLAGAAHALRHGAAPGASNAPALRPATRLMWQGVVAGWLEPARRALGPAVAGAAGARGQMMTCAEAVEYAVAAEPEPAARGAGARSASAGHGRRPVPPPPGAAGRLTAREREVAVLVAQGRTSRQIAAELVIAVSTASRHVEHIMAKLGVHSRAQIATWIAEHAPATPAPS